MSKTIGQSEVTDLSLVQSRDDFKKNQSDVKEAKKRNEFNEIMEELDHALGHDPVNAESITKAIEKLDVIYYTDPMESYLQPVAEKLLSKRDTLNAVIDNFLNECQRRGNTRPQEPAYRQRPLKTVLYLAGMLEQESHDAIVKKCIELELIASDLLINECSSEQRSPESELDSTTEAEYIYTYALRDEIANLRLIAGSDNASDIRLLSKL